jgi:lysophospholipase L1-like esterase
VPKFLLAFCLVLLSACASTPPAHSDANPPQSRDSAKFEPDIAAFERADSLVRRRPGSVVFIGSSSIRMWDTAAEDFPGVPLINRGFGGSRLRDATYYADRIVVAYQPRAVLVYAGDNDIAEGRTPAQVRDDFAAFVAKVRASLPQARIAFVSIKPSPSRQALLAQMREANELVRAWARRQQGVDYLDVFRPMLDEHGQPRPELFVDDQLHMNRSGYAIWAEVVRPWLAAL